MKNCFKLLTIITAISLPSFLMAQKTSLAFVPFAPAGQSFNVITKTDLNLMLPTSTGSDQELPFMNHLPSITPDESKTLFINPSQSVSPYNYSMPIVKPGKTTDIPNRKLDPNSPYIYNMPIRKNGNED